MMDEILSRRTKMTVRRIEDSMPVEPNTIYLIPPKVDLELETKTFSSRAGTSAGTQSTYRPVLYVTR